MIRKKGGRFDYAKTLPETAADQEHQEQPGKPEVLEVLAVPAVLATGSAALLNPSAFALPAQRKGKREDDGTLKRTDVPREQLNVRIRPELKRAAAGLAGLQGMTLGDVVEAALTEYLERAKLL